MYSLESPRGDSHEKHTTVDTFMLEKLKEIALLCLLSWRYDKHSLARTTPLSNILLLFLEHLVMVPTVFEPLKFDCILRSEKMH